MISSSLLKPMKPYIVIATKIISIPTFFAALIIGNEYSGVVHDKYGGPWGILTFYGVLLASMLGLVTISKIKK
jgi:hypothetical protein